ncbi:exported hypothetical protein [uncultured Gammaproteobacteria bacterium]
MRITAPLIALTLVLAGCSMMDGETTDPWRAACESSCDHDYSVCEDAGSARRGGNAMFGGQAACGRQYDNCTKRCKAMTPPKKKPPAQSQPGQVDPSAAPVPPPPPPERSDIREQPWHEGGSGAGTAPTRNQRP